MSEDSKVLELQQRKERIRFGGGTKAIEKQKAMGKMTARERIIALVDADSFQEYDMFVEHDGRDFGMQDKSLPGDGVIIGTGTIMGEQKSSNATSLLQVLFRRFPVSSVLVPVVLFIHLH